MKKTLTALVLVSGLAGIAGTAFASEGEVKIDAPRDQWMSVEQITQKFTDQGYKVRQVKREKGAYEIYALDANGKRIEAYVHPVTGEIIKSDMDD